MMIRISNLLSYAFQAKEIKYLDIEGKDVHLDAM